MLTLRMEPKAFAATAAERDSAIEGLRGCAALAVLYGHLTARGHRLDPGYEPSALFWKLEFSTLAVMAFFILSGYVIGLTNREPASLARVSAYLRRRALRLLPIYLPAVILGWLAWPGPTLRDLLGNFFFLQNAAPDSPGHIALLLGNPNLWSLHYEAIYYLAFIGVWCARPPILLLFGATLVIAAVGAFLPGRSLWLAWLACGFAFWLAGLLVVWRVPQSDEPARSPWLSALLLCAATWRFGALGAVVARADFVVNWVPGVLFTYLDSLPALLWLFLLVSRRRPPWLRWLELASWCWPVAFLSWRVLRHTATGEHGVGFAGGLLALALALRGWKLSLAFWQSFAPVGAISYGLYAFGFPVQVLTRTLLPNSWSGHWWTYAGRVVVTLGLTFAVAWFFERWCRSRLSAGLKRLAAAPALHPF